MLLTESTYSLSISHQMILLVLTKTERTRDHSSINTQRTTIIFIRLLPSTTLLPRGETLFHIPLIIILKTFKDFFACKLVLAANDQQPENIQRLFRLQTCLSRKSSTTRKNSKTFSPANLSQPQIIDNPKKFKDIFACKIALVANHQYPGNIQRFSGQQKQSTAATSNHPATSSSNQQQQSTAATSSSNQQQQSTAAINGSNRQQQLTTTTSRNNQLSSYQQHLHDQRQHLLVDTTAPSGRYPARS